MIPDPQALARDLVSISALAGVPLTATEIRHELLRAPHKRPKLPAGVYAIYVFSLSSNPLTVLKVGKAGPKSKARFESQHYSPGSSNSNLSKSLLSNQNRWDSLGIQALDEDRVGDWIRANTDRDHFFFETEAPLVTLFEAFLQCKLRPLFEE